MRQKEDIMSKTGERINQRIDDHVAAHAPKSRGDIKVTIKRRTTIPNIPVIPLLMIFGFIAFVLFVVCPWAFSFVAHAPAGVIMFFG